MSVQQKMWNVVKGTSKYIYVSNPARGGGLHNYGLAVDISILDEAGNPLPMGTKVDHLGPEAHITNEAALVQSGKMTKQEQANRQLLRSVMRTAGFRALPSEWWHFNWCSRQEAKQKIQGYTIKFLIFLLYLCRQTGKNSIPCNYETSSQTYTFHPVRCMHRLRCSGALHYILLRKPH